jgi:hypothetical protein
MNHKSKTRIFIFQSVSQANMANMNALPLVLMFLPNKMKVKQYYMVLFLTWKGLTFPWGFTS